jgi:hypothetical protein
MRPSRLDDEWALNHSLRDVGLHRWRCEKAKGHHHERGCTTSFYRLNMFKSAPAHAALFSMMRAFVDRVLGIWDLLLREVAVSQILSQTAATLLLS